MSKGKVGAIIAAAGSGERMGNMDKIFVPLRGKPLLAWSVDTCQRYDLVQQVVITLNNNNLEGSEVDERKSLV